MEGIVDVWVGGDGVYWSCTPALLYRIPTQLFDECMLLGSLDTKEDLDALVERMIIERIDDDSYSYTDIWVGQGGNWSGLSSILYKIPSGVFHQLQKRDTSRTIGGLESEWDLEKLVQKTRLEMETGIVEVPDKVIKSRPTNPYPLSLSSTFPTLIANIPSNPLYPYPYPYHTL
jgi:hypothetical protein